MTAKAVAIEWALISHRPPQCFQSKGHFVSPGVGTVLGESCPEIFFMGKSPAVKILAIKMLAIKVLTINATGLPLCCSPAVICHI
jgi:hypothetical protein